MDDIPLPPPRDWIVAGTEARLSVIEVGRLATPEGRIVFLDPLSSDTGRAAGFVAVPDSGGALVVFRDQAEGRNSKLALIFAEAAVHGGAEVGAIPVDTGLVSVFTPATARALARFADTLAPGQDLYNDFFAFFDEPAGGEAKFVPLPDGTPIPYIHSGWGDGHYPVFTLTGETGNVIAVYTDFMGRNDAGAFLRPPGTPPEAD